MRILMCRPDHYGVQYEINPWMKIEHQVDHARALKQWEGLHQAIQDCGAQIDLVSPINGWPDMVFTANAGMLHQGKVILPHFKHKERQGEVPYFKAWFVKAGFDVANGAATTPFFEGAGDALAAGETLFAGYGFRTDKRFYEQASYLDQRKLVYCELTDPYFYHLDTCFCPLNNDLAMWYPYAFTEDSRKRMAAAIELIAVNEEEAKRFACNAVVLNKHVVLPSGCPHITAELEKRGFTVHACDMDEYLKAGGACKCLTLKLD
jgi:N-dimethylarginine dimethylaminohydrolase